MGHAGKHRQYHAETVVKRYRNTEPVLIGKPHRLAGQKPIIENIAVGQSGTFGITRSTAGELNIDRIVGL